jgi:hypothetical protein
MFRLKILQTEYHVPIVLFFLSLIFLQLFIIRSPYNGDTYLYAYSIKTFEGPLLHIGYYLLGSSFYSLLKFFEISPIMSLNLISTFFGSLAISLQYSIINNLTDNKLLGISSAIILLFSGTFWFYAEHGEVYVPQLCFVLLAILFIL